MQKESPKVEHLVDMIQVQSEAVVSRTLINQKSGTVTLFAFDRGQGLSEHTAPYDALVQLLEGEMEITVSGQPYSLGAGDLLLMPANQPHALQAHTGCKMLLTMIRS